jgi:hypothetical protein
MQWKLTPDAPGVQVSLREEPSSAYTDPSAGSYVAPGGATGGVNLSDIPNVPSGLAAQPLQDCISFTWMQSTYFPPGSVYRLYQYTAATPFSSATLIWSGSNTHYLLPIIDSTNPTLYYWVTASIRGVESAPNPGTTAGLPAKSLAITAGFRASASPAGIYVVKKTASITSGNITIGISNGTPTYTYAWTRTSGDASTTVSSSSSATVNFTRGSCVDGTEYDSVWNCHVTDSASHAADVVVSVSITRDSSGGI